MPPITKTIGNTFVVTTMDDPISVVAQYAPNDNPTSGQIHSTWQDGDKYMRTRNTDESFSGNVDPNHPWHKIVGENGDETDYMFAISAQKTTANAGTSPSDIGANEWSDAPVATTQAKPYLWSRVQQKTWDDTLTPPSYVVESTRYIRLTGEGGEEYVIESTQGSVTIGENETVGTLTTTLSFFRKEGGQERSAYSCYCTIFQKKGSTYTKIRKYTTAGASVTYTHTAGTGVPALTATDYDAIVVCIYNAASDSHSGYLAELEIPVRKQGDSPYFADLDNEMDSIACTNEGKPSSEQTVETNVSLYRGSTKLSVTISVSDNTPSGSAYTSGVAKEGITVTWNNTTGNVKVKFSTTPTVGTTNVFCIALTATGSGTSITRYLYFTVNGIRAALDGSPAALYRITPSVNEIVKKKDNSYVPSGDDYITCGVTKNVGGTQSTPSASEYTLKYILNGGAETLYTATSVRVNQVTSNLVFILYVNGIVVDRETIGLVTDGIDGTSPYFADLDNEMDSIACANDGKPSSEQTVETNVKLYRGSTALSPTLAVNDDSPSGAAYTSGTAKDGITVTWNNTTGNIKFKFGTSNSRTKTETFCITLTVTDNGATITRYLYFTVNCIRAALDGNPAALYRLVPSVNEIVKKKDGTYVPTGNTYITCGVTKNVGGTQSTPSASEYTLKYSLNGGAETTYTATSVKANQVTSNLVFILYVNSVVVDRETIGLITDGTDGTSPWTANLDNEMDSVACNVSGNPTSEQTVSTGLSMFYGSSKKQFSVGVYSDSSCTTAYTNSSTVSGGIAVWWTSGYADTNTVNIKVNSALTISGKMTFYIKLTAKDDGTISRVLTFTLNGVRAGANGTSAILYSLVPSVNEVVKKKNNSYVPSGNTYVTCDVKKRVGNNPIVDAPSGEYTLKYSLNGDTETAYTSAGIKVDTITSNLVFILYDKAATPNVLDRETIPLVTDGTDGEKGAGQPSYIWTQEAWSSVESVADETTEPKPNGGWSDVTPSNSINNYAYLWRRSKKMVLQSNGTYSAATGSDGEWKYVRLSGTNGTSIKTKGSAVVVVETGSTLPSKSNDAIGLVENVSTPYKRVNGSWVAQTSSSDGDSYVISESCTFHNVNVLGHLIMWSQEAGKWIDIGQFKGDAGTTYYTHVAWATRVDNVITQAPFPTPPAGQTSIPNVANLSDVTGGSISPSDSKIWMGVLVNTSSTQDDTNWHYYTWSKVQGVQGIQGNDGTSPWIADIDNENDSVFADDSGKILTAQSIMTTASLYHGDGSSSEQFTITKVKRNNSDEFTSSPTTLNNVTVSWTSGVITIAYGVNAVVANKRDTFEITLTSTAVNTIIRTCKMTVLATTGDKYSLVVSPNAMSYNENDTWTNKDVNIKASSLSLDGTVTENIAMNAVGSDMKLAAYYKPSSGGSAAWTDVTGGTSTGRTLQVTSDIVVNNTNILIELRKVKSGAYLLTDPTTYTVEDYETIPINKVKNGRDGSGSNAVKIDLDNEMDGIPCDSDSKVMQATALTTRVRIYDGSTPITGFFITEIGNMSVTRNGSPTNVTITVKDSNGQVVSQSSGIWEISGSYADITWNFLLNDVTNGTKYSSNITAGRVVAGSTPDYFYATFVANVVKSGAAGVSPEILKLFPSSDAIKFSYANGAYTPSTQSITCGYVKTSSSGTETHENTSSSFTANGISYDIYYRFYDKDGNLASGSIDPTLRPNGWYLLRTHIRSSAVDLYLYVDAATGGSGDIDAQNYSEIEFGIGLSKESSTALNTEMVDTERVPILKDGTKGDAGANGTDGEDAHEINPNILLRTVFDGGIDPVKQAWESDWNYTYIDIATDTIIMGRKSIRINSTSQSYVGFSQNVYGRIKTSTWYTLSFNYFATNPFDTYIWDGYNTYGVVDANAGVYVDGVFHEPSETYTVDGVSYSYSLGIDGFHKWPWDWSGGRHSISFKTKSSFGTLESIVLFRCLSGGQLALCMPKLEEGKFATAYMAHEDDLKGEDGARGKTGRFYYYAGEWDSFVSSSSWEVSDAQAPYFSYTPYQSTLGYYVFNPDTNGIYTKSDIVAAYGDPSDNAPWQKMWSDFKYLITEAIFSNNAHLGAFIITGDYQISQYGFMRGFGDLKYDITTNNFDSYGHPPYTCADPDDMFGDRSVYDWTKYIVEKYSSSILDFSSLTSVNSWVNILKSSSSSSTADFEFTLEKGYFYTMEIEGWCRRSQYASASDKIECSIFTLWENTDERITASNIEFTEYTDDETYFAKSVIFFNQLSRTRNALRWRKTSSNVDDASINKVIIRKCTFVPNVITDMRSGKFVGNNIIARGQLFANSFFYENFTDNSAGDVILVEDESVITLGKSSVGATVILPAPTADNVGHVIEVYCGQDIRTGDVHASWFLSYEGMTYINAEDRFISPFAGTSGQGFGIVFGREAWSDGAAWSTYARTTDIGNIDRTTNGGCITYVKLICQYYEGRYYWSVLKAEKTIGAKLVISGETSQTDVSIVSNWFVQNNGS